MRLCWIALLCLTACAEEVMLLPVSCAHVQWPSNEVMRALGFETQPSGGGAAWIYAHAYRTRDWNQVWRQVKRPAETNAGLLGYIAGLRPRFAELTLYDINVDWRTGEQHCEVRLAVDYNGYRRGFFTEGPERFRSTGELERKILELIRLQVWAKGLLAEK
ncbi:MAG: hypothetical protein KatS3mg005_0009 [Bryobacteraceae bacterium]|nr:MAG: hypothetical protein KatS3mg005_0009 [Bryobacteraceae bacterium]